ncbi:MAG: thiolase family protein [Elusimicrobiota bacterium]
MTAFILGGARTAFSTWSRGRRGDGGEGGALSEHYPLDLGARALKAALERSEVPGPSLERVVFANMYQTGSHACYGARYVGLWAGAPETAPCLTLSMACGGGLHALIEAAEDVERGEAELVGTGGTDCASRLRREVFIPSFKDIACGKTIAQTADDAAREKGITRRDMDAWALESHRRALKARRAGLLAEEIVAVGSAVEDDHILPDPAPEHFASSKSVAGSVSEANTHGLVDGASALIVGSERAAKGKKPLGRMLSGAYAALPPERMAYASVGAVKTALKKAGLEPGDIDLYEINETFCGQTLLDMAELGAAADKVNVNGGAAAIGHPFSATGCRLVLTLLLELRRRGARYGVAAISVGGGQGVAVVLEAMSQ